MRILVALFLLASLASAQTTPTAPPPATSPKPSAPAAAEKPADIPPATPVITIPGFCPDKKTTGANCKTEISRQQFDKLAEALNVPEGRRRDLANAYAQMLVLDNAADARGLTKDPKTQQVLNFVRLQTVAQLLARDVRDQAAKVPPEEINAYFNEHKGQYEQATVQRIFIPKFPSGSAQKADEAALKAEAAKMTTEARAPGADMAKLQKQAYEDLKITATPPPVDLKDVRRESIPTGQQKIFDLAPGEVSDAIEESGGFYIYKVISKKTPPVSEVEPEIRRELEQKRFTSEMQKLVGSIKPELNNGYFGAAPNEPPAAPGVQPPAPQASSRPPVSPKSSTSPKTPK